MPITLHDPRRLIIPKTDRQPFSDNLPRQPPITNRKCHFNTPEEIPIHPVRAREINIFPAHWHKNRRCDDARETARRSDRTVMFSERSSTPGFNEQTPCTIRSIFTPACDASYSAAITVGSSRAFILATIRARLPARALSASARIASISLACSVPGMQRKRQLPQQMQRNLPADARQLLKHMVHVLAHFLIGRHQPEVGIKTRRARVIVPKCAARIV